jgi:uncharacterized Zn finger protein (UPF0148 family)
MTPCCENCGGQLEEFEGEPYCPDCTAWEVEEEMRQADAEAADYRQWEAEQAAADLAAPPGWPAGEELPF